MGDRTWVQLNVRVKDLEELRKTDTFKELEEWIEEPPEVDRGCYRMQLYEMNYAAEDELQDLAKQGFMFEGCSGSGSCYGARVFFAKDGQFYDWESGHDGVGLVLSDFSTEVVEKASAFWDRYLGMQDACVGGNEPKSP